MAAGSIEADYVDALRPLPQDIVIDRPAGLIAFNATTLDVTLRRMNVTTVVLTGVSTNVAMPGNTMTAVDLGYHVVIPQDRSDERRGGKECVRPWRTRWV